MIFKRATNRYGETPEPVTPYQKAAQAWDKRMGAARVQAKNWRLIAFGCVVIALVLAAGTVWQMGRSTITPYVVEVDGLGDVRAVGPATESYTPSDAQIAFHLARFIRNVRSLSIDPIVVRQNWLEAYEYATDRGAATLNEYAREMRPFSMVGELTVTAEVTSVVRSSDDTFELRWIERVYRNGALDGTERFTAAVTVVLDRPRTAERLRANPLGIYVHGLNWSRDLVAGGNNQ